MRDGGAGQRHVKHVALGIFGSFLDCQGHFAGLAVTQTHSTGFVANNDDCCELEATTTLHHFGDSVDVHHARLTELAWLCLWTWLTTFAWATLATVAAVCCLWLLYVSH
jgi:hypothetical protein